MCGIAGLLRIDGADCVEADVDLVTAMCATLHHRGPDDRGVEPLGPVVLGSVRLSILDLSPAGHMPMAHSATPGGASWIAYNGEIYNYRELRAELEALGHTFRSNTDTEVCLHALSEWGEEALERFVGMFALALWDAAQQRLLLARDRYGIKPLYWARHAGRIVFASEIKALVEALGNPRVDARSLIEWSLYQNVDVPCPETLVAGVWSVLPGRLVRVTAGQVEERAWYLPPARIDAARFAGLEGRPVKELIGRVEDALEAAVVDRLVSDVPVGTLLSGGLDSSLVTTVAAGHRKDLQAFHVSIAESPDHDEHRYALEVAGGLGIDLVTHTLDGPAFRRELPAAIRLSDAPLTHANSVAYAQICRVAREHGVIVLLSGEGADELFGGYTWRYRRHRNVLRLMRWLERLPRRLRNALSLVGYANAGLPVDSHRFDELLPQGIDLVDRGARRAWAHACEEAYAFVADTDDRAVLSLMLSDLGDFLTPLLRRLDRMSMGASVECRVPFLDHRLVELALHLPLDVRGGRRSDKWILKRAAEKHLRRDLVERRKMGFPLPLADWLAPFARRSLFADGFWLDELRLEPAALDRFLSGWRDRPTALLGLVSCELWGRQTFRGASAGDMQELVERLEGDHGRGRPPL